MPDFAPDATPRYKVRYLSAGFQHTWLFRAARGVSVSTNIASGRSAAEVLSAALESLLPEDFIFLDESYALEDSDIFLPTGALPTQPTGAQALADYTPLMRGTGTTFAGKGGASKARVTAFGVFWDPSDTAGPAANGLVTAIESSEVAAAIAGLTSVTGMRAINNQPIGWYNRATVKENDVYVKLARRLFP
jgi:hypothetical protein